MQIWKWLLKVDSEQRLPLPIGAQLLCVQLQDGEPHLWALVHGRRPKVLRTIVTYGTGEPIPEEGPGRYLGTYQLDGDVWHVFEHIDADVETFGAPV